MITDLISKIYVWFFMKKHADEIKRDIEEVDYELMHEFFISNLLTLRMYATSSKDTNRSIEENNEIFRKKVEEFVNTRHSAKMLDPKFWIYMASRQYPWIQSEWTKEQFYNYVNSLGSKYIPYAETGVEFFEKELPY